jgi:cell division protein FtsZ
MQQQPPTPAATAVPPVYQQMPTQQPMQQPVQQMQQEQVATPIAPIAPAQPVQQQAAPQMQQPQMPQAPNPAEAAMSPRDMLMAKARAFKESHDLKARHTQPEQLSMNVDHEQQSLEEARKMAREVLSSPFSGQNLEVPAFIRKKQGFDLNKE